MKKFIVSISLMFIFSACAVLIGGVNSFAASASTPVGGSADYKVADISHYKTVSDWSAVKSNLDAVYIKATEGTSVTDSKADSNSTGAQSVALKYGFYHVFWPYANGTSADTENASSQADYFYNIIKQYKYSCVPALDLEYDNGCSSSIIVADVKAFIAEFKKLSGQDIMIYCSPDFTSNLDSSLSEYKFWIANYDTSAPKDTSIWHQYTMWQYTSTGTVTGISGDVDCDHATDGIFLDGDTTQFTVDPNYIVSGTSKSVSVTAALDGGTVIVVSTFANGKQSFKYQAINSSVNTYSIPVDSSAVHSSVYLIKGTFDGETIPDTYGFTQPVD